MTCVFFFVVIKCGLNGLFIDDVCYVILHGSPISTTSAAESQCQGKGGTLAHVKTRGLYGKIKTYMEGFANGKRIDVWLGGTYQVSNICSVMQLQWNTNYLTSQGIEKILSVEPCCRLIRNIIKKRD